MENNKINDFNSDIDGNLFSRDIDGSDIKDIIANVVESNIKKQNQKYNDSIYTKQDELNNLIVTIDFYKDYTITKE